MKLLCVPALSGNTNFSKPARINGVSPANMTAALSRENLTLIRHMSALSVAKRSVLKMPGQVEWK